MKRFLNFANFQPQVKHFSQLPGSTCQFISCLDVTQAIKEILIKKTGFNFEEIRIKCCWLDVDRYARCKEMHRGDLERWEPKSKDFLE